MPKTANDEKWIEALRPYVSGGIVPIFYNTDKTVNADRTIAQFCELYDIEKAEQ